MVRALAKAASDLLISSNVQTVKLWLEGQNEQLNLS